VYVTVDGLLAMNSGSTLPFELADGPRGDVQIGQGGELLDRVHDDLAQSGAVGADVEDERTHVLSAVFDGIARRALDAGGAGAVLRRDDGARGPRQILQLLSRVVRGVRVFGGADADHARADGLQRRDRVVAAAGGQGHGLVVRGGVGAGVGDLQDDRQGIAAEAGAADVAR
jgi:hypothetical protein